jgi:hypothetical protein
LSTAKCFPYNNCQNGSSLKGQKKLNRQALQLEGLKKSTTSKLVVNKALTTSKLVVNKALTLSISPNIILISTIKKNEASFEKHIP